MAYLDEDQRRRARARNIAQTFTLVGGIGIVTALSAYTLFGVAGIFWGLALVGLFALFGPRVAPDAIMRMFTRSPWTPSAEAASTGSCANCRAAPDSPWRRAFM